ncbi:MAG TPA: glycosyltransferase [Candidatus Limnocylindrales bacterium]|nr:glycosyltransferase [Candidatus Limnocylindrales bacterium]
MQPFLDAMPAAARNSLLALHLVLWGLLAAYGIHRVHLLRLFRRRARPAARPDPPETWPRVTIQLPVYNERYVAERLLDAAAAMDYPAGRLEIQILDDSTDRTSALVAAKAADLVERGHDVVHLRRAARDGFKAGALQHGLLRAKGDLLAIFDADFVPPPSFLRDLVPYLNEPDVGMVQARWRHLNQDYSLLSQAQAISLDGHFVIEHAARMSGGRFFNFNGTAGILRKRCIEEAGGWQWDTLTEDLDLSYRAQLKGWRFVFAPEVGCPSELPVEMNAFKTQQYRWVKGSIQVARKLLPSVWRSRLPLPVKIEATFHLTVNVAYVLLFLVSALAYPVVIARIEAKSLLFTVVDAALFLTASIPALVYFAAAQRATRRDWRRQLRFVPFVLTLGLGLAVNNTRAVITGLVGGASDFQRTPKFSIERRGDGWSGKRYRSPVTAWAGVEISMGLYFAWAMISLAHARLFAPLPFLLLYMAGFLYVGLVSVLHAVRRA